MSDYKHVRSYIEIEHLKTMSYEEINNVLTDQKNRIDKLENNRDDGWIKCSDRLPDVIGYYLAYGKDKIYWVFFNSEKKMV